MRYLILLLIIVNYLGISCASKQKVLQPSEFQALRGPITITAVPKYKTLNFSYYNTVRGDTLWSISDRVFGDSFLWPLIADVNKIDDPDCISIGMRLRYPLVLSNDQAHFISIAKSRDTYTTKICK